MKNVVGKLLVISKNKPGGLEWLITPGIYLIVEQEDENIWTERPNNPQDNSNKGCRINTFAQYFYDTCKII